jgi:outer membrane protein, multidrug efflux system
MGASRMHAILLTLTLALAPDDWWKVYQDPELSRIVEKALANNTDLAAATQRIAEARAVSGETRSKLGPQLNLTGSAQQLRGGFAQNIIRVPQPSGAQQGGAFVAPFETGIIQGGLDMKWELDFFGTNRAALSAARSDVVNQEELRGDLGITVSAEAARNYMELRGIEERLRITQQNIAAQRDLLELTRIRLDAGLATQVDIERQTLLLANTEAALPELESELAVRRNRLAVLTGDENLAVAASAAPERALEAPKLDAGVSSELLKRRPDVRAAEARISAAMARMKQARTDLYPKINLNGLVGRQGTSLTSLSLGGGNFFSIGPQLQLPLFNNGRIKSNIAASEARLEQEKLAYRNEILAAFEEAANAIAALTRQKERESKLNSAVASAKTALELSVDLQKAGLNDFLSVLDSQRGVFDADLQRSTAHTQVLVESVKLYKALAGAWPQP